MNIREDIITRINGVAGLVLPYESCVKEVLKNSTKEKDFIKSISPYPELEEKLIHLIETMGQMKNGEKGTIAGALDERGLPEIADLLMTVIFQPFICNADKSYDLFPPMLWKHSVAVAVTSEEIALSLGLEKPQFLYISGLLHDLGKLLLGQYDDLESGAITGMALRERVTIDIAERQVLGIDHAEAGAELLESWDFPDSIIDAVRWHHQPDRFDEPRLLIDLVHTANALTYVCDICHPGSDLKQCPSCYAISRLNLTTRAAENSAENAVNRMLQLKSLLGP